MSREFRDCLKRGKIIPFQKGSQLVAKELQSARDDLEDAIFGFGHGRYKWSTIQGYYSMYHAARALIFSRGYRERSHFCLFVALQELFVDRGLLDTHLVGAFRYSMRLRETADYGGDFSKDGATAVIELARDLLTKAGKLSAPK